jgi:hypothetical protein
VCHNPEVSTYELARQLDTRQMTCWKLKKKMMECIETHGELRVLDHSFVRKTEISFSSHDQVIKDRQV